MDSYNNFDTATNGWTGSGTPQYSYNERIAYDGNGNILKYLRNANTYNSGPVMDSLTYKYYTGTNRLQRVTDRATSFDSEWGANSWEYNLDINHQTQTSNYLYDPIGNLIKDTSEKITSIKWSVYGKIQEINRVANTQNPVTKIIYKYDAQGNRIGKIVTKNTGVREHTWYVRDAQGNVMATYGASGTNADNALNGLTTGQNERYIYGSSRLGVDNWYMPADSNTVYDYNYPGLNSATYYYRRGWKQYELSNHLGNVLATISDKKNGIPLPSSSLIDYYEPVVVSAQDYYPFGMLMPKRSYSSAAGYRYGFNGKENDNEVKGLGNQMDYGFRIYDPRIGRFLSVDPLFESYPWYTPYQFAGNTPMQAIDLDGMEEAYPKLSQKVPVLRSSNASESTCIGCAGKSIQLHKAQQQIALANLEVEYQAWLKEPGNYGKPLPSKFISVAPKPGPQEQLKQGGVLGTDEYKIVKARYNSYGQYLPGPSDIVDGLTAIDELSKGNYKAAAAAGFFLIPGADIFKPVKALKGVGGELLEGYLKKFGKQADHLTKLDIQGALKDIANTPVLKKSGIAFQHLKEVEEALSGVGNQINKLTKDINAGKFTDEVLKQAEAIRGTLQKQKDKLTDVLNEAKKNAQ